jgi:hypothetical protein
MRLEMQAARRLLLPQLLLLLLLLLSISWSFMARVCQGKSTQQTRFAAELEE